MPKRLLRFSGAAALAVFVVINLVALQGSDFRAFSLLAAMAAFGFVVRRWWALLFALVPIFVYLPAGSEGLPAAGEEPPGWVVGILVVPMLAAATAAGIAAGKMMSVATRRRRSADLSGSGA